MIRVFILLLAVMAALSGELTAEQKIAEWLTTEDGNWNDADKWTPNVVPNNGSPSPDDTYTAIISAGVNTLIRLTDDVDVDELRIASRSRILHFDGVLSTPLLRVDAGVYSFYSSNMGNPEMRGVTIQGNGGVHLGGNVLGKSTLNNVTIDTHVSVDPEVRIEERGLGLFITNGIRITSGNELRVYANDDRLITFDGTQTISGPGAVVGTAGRIIADITEGSELTIAADTTVVARSGNLRFGVDSGRIINRGTLEVQSEKDFSVASNEFVNFGEIEANGGRFILQGKWDNQGNISTAQGGTIVLDGQFTVPNMGSINLADSGQLQIAGQFDLLGGAFTMDDSTGDVAMWATRQRGGGRHLEPAAEIRNGRIESQDGRELRIGATSRLDNMTIGSGLVVSAAAHVTNGITLDNTIVPVNAEHEKISSERLGFVFDGDQELNGTGRIEYARGGSLESNGRLVISDGITIVTGDGDFNFSGVEIVNNGEIITGTELSDKVSFTVDRFVNNGKLDVAGSVGLGTGWVNNGSMNVLPEGVLTVGGGSLTAQSLGDVSVLPEGRLKIEASTIDQTNVDLKWNQLADVELMDGKIVGGSIPSETGTILRGEFELDAVTIRGHATVLRPDFSGTRSGVRIRENLHLDGGTFAIQDLTRLTFEAEEGSPPAITGSGELVWLQTSRTNSESEIGHADLEIGSGITLRTEGIDSNGERTLLARSNHGKIVLSTPDTSFHLSLRNNSGTIEVANPDTVVNIGTDQDWENTGLLRATSGRIVLNGRYQSTSLRNIEFEDGRIELAGEIDNTNNSLGRIPWTELTGSIRGGQIAFDPTLEMKGSVFDATVTGEITVPEYSHAYFKNTTFNAAQLRIHSEIEFETVQGDIGIEVFGTTRSPSHVTFTDPMVLSPSSTLNAAKSVALIDGQLINQGQVEIDGFDADVKFNQAFENSGTFRVSNGGSAVVRAPTASPRGGRWEVDTRSRLQFDQPWELTANDTIEVTFTGTPTASTIRGTELTANGTLRISTADGFLPRSNTAYPILDFETTIGNFAELQLDQLPTGFSWDTSEFSTTGVLFAETPAESSIAFTLFSESEVGAASHSPGVDAQELGFTSVINDNRGAEPFAGVVRVGELSPQSFLAFQSVESQTTFETIRVSDFASARLKILLQVSDTSYENDDYIRVHVSNGVDELLAIDLSEDELVSLAGRGFREFETTVPTDWFDVTTRIETFTNSSRGDERVEIASLVFSGFSLEDVRGAEGDFNLNGKIDAGDIDKMSHAIRNGSSLLVYDQDASKQVDANDRLAWIRNKANTWIGDANLDGEFNSSDFVVVFAIGQYEDAIDSNSSWASGDWNGDGDFTTQDFVAAFQDGGYEKGRRQAQAVPEPATIVSMGMVLLLLAIRVNWRPATIGRQDRTGYR